MLKNKTKKQKNHTNVKKKERKILPENGEKWNTSQLVLWSEHKFDNVTRQGHARRENLRPTSVMSVPARLLKAVRTSATVAYKRLYLGPSGDYPKNSVMT